MRKLSEKNRKDNLHITADVHQLEGLQLAEKVHKFQC